MRPDAVVVASNGKRQVQHAIQAMEAGCHVLSEVPGAYPAPLRRELTPPTLPDKIRGPANTRFAKEST